MMNNGSPATQPTSGSMSPEQLRAHLNTYIYEYFLKLGHYDIARSLLREDKFEIRTKPPVKQSPGRRKDTEVNGVDADAMDTDVKDDIPDDLPRPFTGEAASTPGIGFLYEWFSIFSDLYTAHSRSSKLQSGQPGNMGPAAQYLLQHHVRHLVVIDITHSLPCTEHATHAREPATPKHKPPRHDEPPIHACC